MRRKADRIFLEGMTFSGQCGVKEEEKRERRKILVDIEVAVSCAKAGRSDELKDTVDYGKLYQVAKRIVAGKTVALLERWAELIAQEVLRQPKVKSVRVRIRKPGVIAKGISPGVEIVRTRESYED